MKLLKLFIGGHREIKRPVLSGNDALLQRMEQAGRELRAHGKDVKALIGPKAQSTPAAPQHLKQSARVETKKSAPVVTRLAKRPAPNGVMDDSFAELDAVVVAMKRALHS